jgi:hypothetical protein
MPSTKLSLAAVATLALAGRANAIAVDLTTESFDAQIAGKGAFVKFFAPWCVARAMWATRLARCARRAREDAVDDDALDERAPTLIDDVRNASCGRRDGRDARCATRATRADD